MKPPFLKAIKYYLSQKSTSLLYHYTPNKSKMVTLIVLVSLKKISDKTELLLTYFQSVQSS